MATLGNTFIGASILGVESTITGILVIMPQHGTIYRLWAYLQETTADAQHSAIGLVGSPAFPNASGNPNLVRPLSWSLPSGQRFKLAAPAWYSFDITPSLFVQSGDPLVLAIYPSSGGGNLNVYQTNPGAGTFRIQNAGAAGAGFPLLNRDDPFAMTTAGSERLSIYVEYTPGDTRVNTVYNPPPSYRPQAARDSKTAMVDTRAWW